MSRYDDEYTPGNQMNRTRDLVLSINEFCFVQNKTDGTIRTQVGPTTVTISGQESLVNFNSRTKQFVETNDITQAKQLFISAPEGWYIVLKNPAPDNKHPEGGKSSISPALTVGKKINISGPASFALYPGQMAKVVRGHRLRSNQYLLARVYDAEAASAGISEATIVDAEGKEVKQKAEKYFVGQLLVIKGTEISFYIPPTGIEVIPVNSQGGEYVRDAVTLERLEYAILKDEDGEKRYVHGPAVVFPKPTETFVESPKKGNIFRALELSPISGIYIKVIAAYEENGIKHPIGEELFITGKDQMIYYPRPEHAMIQYDGKYMHHAIAIPEGEGRYILNRLTGEITTIKGPQMYLPDPRTEVVVKRKLSRKECNLMYPGNNDVLNYNAELSEIITEKAARKGLTNTTADVINNAYCTANQESALAIFEANANISRGVSYTKPRTITLDTKFDGAVSVNVWTGYAINVVAKDGTREVVIGPKTRLLDYDETLEAMPETTDQLLSTVYLRVENNKISDVINIQTKDYVDVQIKVSYCVDFLEKYKDKWFSVDNYVKFLCDRMRSMLKREAKKYDIQDFYTNSTDIIRNLVLNIEDNDKKKETTGRLFTENGMFLKDVEVLSIGVERSIAVLLENHQAEKIEKIIELSDAEAQMQVVKALAEVDKKKAELDAANRLYREELNYKVQLDKLAKDEEFRIKHRAAKEAEKQAEADLQKILDTIQAAELARMKAKDDACIEQKKAEAAIEEAKQKAYAETIKSIMESIQPDLVAALTSSANADLMKACAESLSPYAIANGESISETVNTLMRGTSLEGILKDMKNNATNV